MSDLMTRIKQENLKQKMERKRLDKITQDKSARSSREKISPKAERKTVDTAPPWAGDIPFNKGKKNVKR